MLWSRYRTIALIAALQASRSPPSELNCHCSTMFFNERSKQVFEYTIVLGRGLAAGAHGAAGQGRGWQRCSRSLAPRSRHQRL